jgi:hypothetical protein
VARQPVQPQGQHHTHHDSNDDKKPALPTARLAQKTERGATVVHQGEIERRQHRHRLMHDQLGAGQQLGDLIERDDHYREPQPFQHRYTLSLLQA